MASIAILAWMAVVSAVIRQHGAAPGAAFLLCQAACLASGAMEAGAIDGGGQPPRAVYATRSLAFAAFAAQLAMAVTSA